MWSDWTDYLIATRTKAGVYTVWARKWTDRYLDGNSKKIWVLIDAVRDIKSASTFIKAVQRCAETLHVEVYWPDVLQSLSSLDPYFSKEVEAAWNEF